MKKRILFVISGLEKGGAETQLFRLILGLKKQNVECSVFALRGGYYQSILSKEGVPVTITHARISNLSSVSAQFYEHIRLHKPDLVHSWLPHANILCKILLTWKYRNLPLLASIRVKENKYWYQIALERILDFRTERTLVNQKSIKRHLIRWTFSAKKIAYIGNILDIPQPNEKNVAAIQKKYKSPIVLTVGHFRPQKNYKTTLRVLEDLHKDLDFQAIFIGGPGKDFDWVQSYITRKKLSFISLLPPDSTVIDFMHASDVFFLPSLYEGHSNVLMEAISCKTPIVSSDLEENQWVKNAAILREPKDTVGLKGALRKILSEPEYYVSDPKVYTFIKKQHESSTIADQYQMIYDEVLKRVRN